MVRAIFIHLPKTAGTSFRDALTHGFGQQVVSPSFNASFMTESEAEYLSRFEVICGHISFADIQRFFADVPMLTVLREPVDRCLSWYYYARNLQPLPHADVAAAQRYSVSDFFSLDQKITFRNIFNRQVRQLGAHVLDTDTSMDQAFVQATVTLKKCVWVGHYESLAQDMDRLGSVFPEMIGQSIKRLNVTRGRARCTKYTGLELREKINRYNAYDIALCAAALCRHA